MKVCGTLRCSMIVATLLLAGCVVHQTAKPPPVVASAPATQPSNPHENVPLEKVVAGIALPPPATQPSTPPSLDALQVYAQARAAVMDDRASDALTFLQRAASLDPNSFEVQNDLAEVYLATTHGGVANEAFFAALEKAAQLEPDHLDIQYELGRQYLTRGDSANALFRLRCAQLTTEYRSEASPDVQIMTQFFLARALSQSNYIVAAIDEYRQLVSRIVQPDLIIRGQPDLVWLMHHPQVIYVELGELYERHGLAAAAVEAYQQAKKSDPDSLDVAVRLVRSLLAAGRFDEARNGVADLVYLSHAAPPTLSLLREVYRDGDPNGPAHVLTQLHEAHPSDRPIFYALLDELKRIGRTDESERLLIEATRQGSADPDFIRRLFALYQSRNDIESSMRLLVQSLAARPDSLRDLAGLWDELLAPASHSHLRLATLQALQVPPDQQAARLFWISRLAELWNRDALIRSSLQQAAAIKPPFAPAYRDLLADDWARTDWSTAQKIQASEQLAKSCQDQDRPALAAELRGLTFLQQKQSVAATRQFAAASSLGNHSPDLQLLQARALIGQGDAQAATQLLTKVITDSPRYEDAYSELFNVYIEQRSGDQALAMLQKWLAAVPDTVEGRLVAAMVYAEQGSTEQARALYDALFSEQPQNVQVLRAMQSFYLRHGAASDLITKLEAERTKNPRNRAVVEMLISIYADQKRPAEAKRVLEAAQVAVANDPDLLYYVALLYQRIEQKQMTEQILLRVLQIDPANAPANNDLGYTWADEGRNLAKAEVLVKRAVEAEPDNQSYLDSMAWVEYKLGKFSEARGFLDRAIGPASRPDPVVLDHLGDVLYRLHLPSEAASQWQRSLKRLDDVDQERDDLKPLREQLEQKLKQQQQGKPVDVAPLMETSGNAAAIHGPSGG